MSSGDGVLAALAQLQAAVTALAVVPVQDLSDAGLLDAARVLRPVVCQVQAVEANLVGVIHARGAGRSDGASSTTAWLRGGLRMDDAAARVRSAMLLRRCPQVAAAFAAGQISDAHVAVIAKVARDISDEAMAGGVEELLTAQARQLSPTRLAPVAARIRDECDPDAADRRHRARLRERWLDVDRTFDGAVSVSGLLDPESGELLLSTLGALTPPPKPGDIRGGGARRADALIDLCRLAAHHAPVAGGEKPHLIVTLDLATLQTQLTPTPPTQTEPEGRNGPEDRNRPEGRSGPERGSGAGPESPTTAMPTGGARLGSGWPIRPETARRLACDAAIIPMLLGTPSEPLDVGRLSRTAPPPLRRALIYRDGGCRFPLCDRPPEWTDAHHLKHWADFGPTALSNMALLCRRHHVAVHEEGWSITLNPHTAEVSVRRPDGTPFTTTSSPRGTHPVKGQPPGTTHRKPHPCT
jgi:hypothetical protein